MKTTQILIAGFGGQGILFAGKFLAYKGLKEDLQVSWLPSYGPEMRGGTANCNVILSETPVGSPIITTPDVLIAMNLPSLQKYVDTVPRKRAHTSSVNRKGLPGLFHHSKRGIVARKYGQKTLDNRQWSCPVLNSFGPGAEEERERTEGEGTRCSGK